ncbi:hypothetical protein LIER_11171 [Lithospermum erythrorhizon]|uniref:Reverse transcriptase domain-containing protein n=1 Tax=Lithospermum erythrorhizon TaxID=34254 RepID=A0AAV3PM27_LITER
MCLRQGDPLSPILFALCTETLSSLLQFHQDQDSLKGIGLARNRPKLTHLLFADDSYFFMHLDNKSLDAFPSSLSIFCSDSCQIINLHKSVITFSPLTPRNVKSDVLSALGIVESSLFGNYLDLQVKRTVKFDPVKRLGSPNFYELILFGNTLWVIWITRNDTIFNHVDPNISRGLDQARKFALDWFRHSKKSKVFFYKSRPTTLGNNQQESSILFQNASLLRSNGCKRICRMRDSKIYLGTSNDKVPKWLINVFLEGSRTTIEGSYLLNTSISSTRNIQNLDYIDNNYVQNLSLLSVAQAIFTALILAKGLVFHSIYIVTDGFFSHVWFRNYHKLKNNEDWKKIMQEEDKRSCEIFWLPTNVGYFWNLKDIIINTFNVVLCNLDSNSLKGYEHFY